MQWVKEKVRAELVVGLRGPDPECEYHPCHYEGQDCSWCFCPFYPCEIHELGDYVRSSRTGEMVWSCVDCEYLHRPEVATYVAKRVKELFITDPEDPRLKSLFKELQTIHRPRGKAIMVLGATSDAGKSLTVTALCRIISDMGYTVAPFKSQNMSLNSFVTRSGDEISRAQQLQAMAARMEPDFHVNPILLKPKGDSISQVVVDGRPFADYDVRSYYGEFIPQHGFGIMERNLEYLKRKYDYVVMEGAGSPAEINIYDRDIANMGAAKAADADCILVVNIERGGAFAYAYGTIMLIPEEDRRLVKGIIINNMHGDPSYLDSGIAILEERLGIPVLGVVPHLDLKLPKEDSLGCKDLEGDGPDVAVIRLPRISNFTDFDALEMDGARVRYVTAPGQLEGADLVVIPGSKNTVGDLEWLRSSGFANHLTTLAGKVPILGICGGYQMMGSVIEDPFAIEGDEPSTVEGLGLLDITTRFDSRDKHTKQVQGEIAAGGGRVRGYEIHMGSSDRGGHDPLFLIEEDGRMKKEGCLDMGRKLMGSYLHGLFDLPDFRRFALDLAGCDAHRGEDRDHKDSVEENLDILADAFRKALDMAVITDEFMEVMGSDR